MNFKHSKYSQRLVFSTCPWCSQMPVAFYHNVIHGLGFRLFVKYIYLSIYLSVKNNTTLQLENIARMSSDHALAQFSSRALKSINSNRLFLLNCKCACLNSIFLLPVCTSTYRMVQNKTLIMALNLELSVSVRAHALCQICSVKRHIRTNQMEEIARKLLSIYGN